jgi:hypothetical protein
VRPTNHASKRSCAVIVAVVGVGGGGPSLSDPLMLFTCSWSNEGLRVSLRSF